MKVIPLILLFFITSCGKKEKSQSINFVDSNNDLVSDQEVNFYNLEKDKFLTLFETQISGSFSITTNSQTKKKSKDIPLSQNSTYFREVLQNKIIASTIQEDKKLLTRVSSYLRNPFYKVITCLTKNDMADLNEVNELNNNLLIRLNQNLYFESLLPEAEMINIDYDLNLINPILLEEYTVLSSRSVHTSPIEKSLTVKDAFSFLSSPICLVLKTKKFNLKTPLRVISYDSKKNAIVSPDSFNNIDPYKRSTAIMNLEPLMTQDIFKRENQLIDFSNEKHNLQIEFSDLYDTLSKKEVIKLNEVTSIDNLSVLNGEKIQIQGHFYKEAILPKLISNMTVDCAHRDITLNGHCYCIVTKSYKEIASKKAINHDETISITKNNSATFVWNSYREFEFYNSYLEKEQKLSFDFQKKSFIELEEHVTYEMRGGLRNKCPAAKFHRVRLPAKYYFTGKVIKSSL